jgi:DNA-binding transcriptional MerR regulator
VARKDGAASPVEDEVTSNRMQQGIVASKLHETHVSGIEALHALKVRWHGLEGLIAAGSVKVIIGKKGEGRVFLVEKASLEDLKKRLERALFITEAERLLKIPRARIQELIGYGLLKPLRGPDVDGSTGWKLDGSEVRGLIDRLLSKLPRKRSNSKRKTVSFTRVLWNLGRAGISLGAFIQAMLDGEVKAVGRSGGSGLRCLLFSNQQITNYVDSEFRLLAGDVLSIRQISKQLKVTQTAVRFLAKKGLIKAEKCESAPCAGILVRRDEFDLFNESYLLARELAANHRTSPVYMVNLLSERNVRPVTGPNVDGGRIYLFKRGDVEPLDVVAILKEGRKRGAAVKKRLEARNSVLDAHQAAEILGVDVETVRQLTERGVLKTNKRLAPSLRKSGEYFFTRHVIERYKDGRPDRTDLVAFMVAAKIFDLCPDNFYTKYIKTKRLKPVAYIGRRSEYFFRMEDIETLLTIQEQTITSSEAARILGVSPHNMRHLVDAGDLKPISGPNIDGFGINLFLRMDVEELHAKRETYKAKRIKEGKTSRFGKQRGPLKRPVQDMIGPRIERLIERWKKQTPHQHITGSGLHQQLVREGYQVGINSVYVYLQQKRQQAA